jgi:hypothetical protein
LTPPAVGEHMTAMGTWVTDINHGWNELHPIFVLNGQEVPPPLTPQRRPPFRHSLRRRMARPFRHSLRRRIARLLERLVHLLRRLLGLERRKSGAAPHRK